MNRCDLREYAKLRGGHSCDNYKLHTSNRQATTRPQRSCASRIEPRQVRPRTDPVPAPHSTLARRRRPGHRIRFRLMLCPSIRVSARHDSRISDRALQTCLQHRRSPASAICWPWPARRSASQTVNIRRTRVLLCRTFSLERSS